MFLLHHAVQKCFIISYLWQVWIVHGIVCDVYVHKIVCDIYVHGIVCDVYGHEIVCDV